MPRPSNFAILMAKVRINERNAKGKLAFLFISKGVLSILLARYPKKLCKDLHFLFFLHCTKTALKKN